MSLQQALSLTAKTELNSKTCFGINASGALPSRRWSMNQAVDEVDAVGCIPVRGDCSALNRSRGIPCRRGYFRKRVTADRHKKHRFARAIGCRRYGLRRARLGKRIDRAR